MKSFITKSMLLLIVFYCLERFTHFSLLSSFHFFQNAGFAEKQSDFFRDILIYLPLISLLFAAVLIDRLKFLRNMKLYLIPVIAGLTICLIPNFYSLIVGLSVFAIAASFIKVNVIVKLFTEADTNKFFDDRVFILLFLMINVFTALTPIPDFFIPEHYIHYPGAVISPLVLWLIFGVIFWIFFRARKPENQKTSKEFQSVKLYMVLGIIVLGLALFAIISKGFYGQKEKLLEMGYNLKMEIIPYSFVFILSIALLFITIFRIKQKLIVSLILMLVVSTFVGLITFSESNVKFYSYLIIILLTGIEIIVYAAVLGLLLRLSKKDVQATHIAIYLLFSSAISLAGLHFISFVPKTPILLAIPVFVVILYLVWKNKELERI